MRALVWLIVVLWYAIALAALVWCAVPGSGSGIKRNGGGHGH